MKPFKFIYLFCTLLFAESLWIQADFRDYPEYQIKLVQELSRALTQTQNWEPISPSAIEAYTDSIRSDRRTSSETKMMVREFFSDPYVLKIRANPAKIEESRILYWPVANERTLSIEIYTSWYNSEDSLLLEKSYSSDFSETDWYCGVLTCKTEKWPSGKKSTLIQEQFQSLFAELTEESKSLIKQNE